ncbi:MAG TPA: biopolymer transporter ExbD [Verrucomicrobiae bacterium]|jgi:biopolymer transport protein ExbD|nr:biopolymer transporter ExbD [Verrucomicrobiae bacterium]
MRRFSQRNSLVTLSDINITPLLDLAFVLLIIFVITTPLLEKGLDLQLPAGVGRQDKTLQKKDIHVVEVSLAGYYVLDHKAMKLDQISRVLEDEFRANPNMLVFIRADENGKYKLVADILDRCERIGITRLSLRGDAREK